MLLHTSRLSLAVDLGSDCRNRCRNAAATRMVSGRAALCGWNFERARRARARPQPAGEPAGSHAQPIQAPPLCLDMADGASDPRPLLAVAGTMLLDEKSCWRASWTPRLLAVAGGSPPPDDTGRAREGCRLTKGNISLDALLTRRAPLLKGSLTDPLLPCLSFCHCSSFSCSSSGVMSSS